MKVHKSRLRVFICHAAGDQPIARDLHAQLIGAGWMEVWFIESNLTIYDDWEMEIQKAVNQADVIIALISSSSFKQDSYVYPEPNFVFSILDARQAGDFYLIPLRLGRSGIPAEIVRDSPDFLPKDRRRIVGQQVLEALTQYAADRGFSREGQPPSPDPTPGLQWSPTNWRKVGGLFLEEFEDENSPAPKPTRPPSKWKGRISTGLNQFVHVSLIALVLFVLLAVGLVINFVNTGKTINAVADPIISGALTLIPLPAPTLGVGSIQVSNRDGMRMVYVPAGEFIMGSDDGAEDEKPFRTVDLDAYWIDQFEVTNEMYKECVEYGKCNPPDYRGANALVHQDLIPLLEPIIRFYDDPRYADYPISRITWDDAVAYCSWVGRRLPTEAEWEKAARGTDGRTYPWGEEVDCTRANVYEFPADKACAYAPTRVGSYERGVSPFGAYDMAGNVFEFVSDDYEYILESEDGVPSGVSVDFFRVQKGGSWVGSGQTARSANRELWNSLDGIYDPNLVTVLDPNGENGFRCAVSADAPVPEAVNTPIPTPGIVDPQVSPVDGMQMVHIPAGEFIMGSDYFEEDEKPAHRVYLDAYWIDQFEVTNQQYAICMDENGCSPPLSYFWLDDHFSDPEYARHPVTGASWENAAAYCAWAGRRLPTEAEWEKAARGSFGQTYPWGEQISCEHANFHPCTGDLLRVGSFEEGKSPYGAYDMAGNVMEWVADWYGRDYYERTPFENPQGPESGRIRVYKGGSWANRNEAVRASNRFEFMTSIPYRQIGFRCAASGDVPDTQSIDTTAPTQEIESEATPADRMQIVYVPAGEFVMGGDEYFEEQPIHSVILDAFWIDQTEVTNLMFASFLNEWGNRREGSAALLDVEDEDARIHFVATSWRADPLYEDHPVVEVTWYGANAYCAWAGKHLPTEAEWEKAARGTSGNVFPWGNYDPNAGLLNFDSVVGGTTSVGSYPEGMSPFGVLDMAGNVWEWVADRHSGTYYSFSPLENPLGPGTGFFRALRGGGWNSRDTFVRSMHRNRGAPTISHGFVGFRCALSASE